MISLYNINMVGPTSTHARVPDGRPEHRQALIPQKTQPIGWVFCCLKEKKNAKSWRRAQRCGHLYLRWQTAPDRRAALAMTGQSHLSEPPDNKALSWRGVQRRGHLCLRWQTTPDCRAVLAMATPLLTVVLFFSFWLPKNSVDS